jgi:hypothetical protein
MSLWRRIKEANFQGEKRLKTLELKETLENIIHLSVLMMKVLRPGKSSYPCYMGSCMKCGLLYFLCSVQDQILQGNNHQLNE